MAIYYLSFYILALYILFLNLVNGTIISVKIIKESNLVDLNKYYFTLHNVGSLYSQEYRELQSKEKGLQPVIFLKILNYFIIYLFVRQCVHQWVREAVGGGEGVGEADCPLSRGSNPGLYPRTPRS